MNSAVMSYRLLRKLACLLVFITSCSVFSAHAQSQPAVAQVLVGTIERVAQDSGYVRISGRNYSFDSEITEVLIGGEPVRGGELSEGMAVRFSISSQSQLIRIEILGPFNQTRLLDQN